MGLALVVMGLMLMSSGADGGVLLVILGFILWLNDRDD